MASREEQFLELKGRAEQLINELQSHVDGISQTRDQATSQVSNIESTVNRSNELRVQLEQLVTDLQTRLQELNDSITQTTNRETDTKTLYDKLSGDIEALRSKAEDLVSTSETQQTTIAEQLKKANAAGLFHAFDTEKTDHRTSAMWWAGSIGGTLIVIVLLAVISLGYSDGVFHWHNIFGAKGSSLDLSTYLRKLTLITPFIFWLVLSTRQFSKARRLQDEYAFKSTISLSLEAYRDMLRKEAEQPESAKDVIPVLAKAVDRIFSSPTANIAKHGKEDKDLLDHALAVIEAQSGFIQGAKKNT